MTLEDEKLAQQQSYFIAAGYLSPSYARRPRKTTTQKHQTPPFLPNPVSILQTPPAPSSTLQVSPIPTLHPSIDREDTTINHSEIDYQSLPSPPEPAYWSYDPGFGERVQLAYRVSIYGDYLRAGKYGAEVAREYRSGYTPSPARRKWCEQQEEALRLDELGMPGADDYGCTTGPGGTPREHGTANAPEITEDGLPNTLDGNCITTRGSSHSPTQTLHTDQSSVVTFEKASPCTTNIQPTSQAGKKRQRSDTDNQPKGDEELQEARQPKRTRLSELFQLVNGEYKEPGGNHTLLTT